MDWEGYGKNAEQDNAFICRECGRRLGATARETLMIYRQFPFVPSLSLILKKLGYSRRHLFVFIVYVKLARRSVSQYCN